MLAEHASNLGQYALKRISEMMERHPLIGNVRGLGLFKDRATREWANDESEAAMYSALSKELGVKLSIRQISYRLFVNCHGQNDFR
jgi:4-aminobutyrate aminotransferase